MCDMHSIFHLQMRCIPPGEKPDRFQVTAMAIDNDENEFLQVTAIVIDDDEREVHSSNDTLVALNSNGTVLISISDSDIFGPYRKYNATITSRNEFGESKSTEEISFSKPVHNCL